MAKILVVDDVQTDREILGKVVARMGHTPIYAADGGQAVNAAREGQLALILLDVVMPGMDGFKVCRTLKADPALARIPVVLVTSKGGASDVFWGKRQGADDHVAKPYTLEAMEAVIRRHAGG
ncbi:MAG TPA: response regulator [Candidatus Acidoferrum sp.]|nr:response regulator [Candidatus Acidoferrum sp.]